LPEFLPLHFEDLGKRSYASAWDLQEKYLQETLALKLQRRQSPEIPVPQRLLFTEHFPPVFTLGKSGDASHLLAAEEFLREQGIEFFRTNRGGDITFHGEGQIVGYPILDLDQIYTDIHRYLRELEEVIILTLGDFGIPNAGRKNGLTGVWVDDEKLCAIGVRTSRWVTMHGFALNVNTDLHFFDFIVPCGIRDKKVGSMQQILGKACPMEEVKNRLLTRFCEVFHFQLRYAG
jgi:lipoyl(octanoyl) transferase